MRSDELVGTAHMVSIYGRKYDVIFKYTEINSSGENSRGLPQPQQTDKSVTDFS